MFLPIAVFGAAAMFITLMVVMPLFMISTRLDQPIAVLAIIAVYGFLWISLLKSIGF